MVHEPVLPGLTGREDAVVISVGLRSVDTPAAVHSEHVLDLRADPDDLVRLQDALGNGTLSLRRGLVEQLTESCTSESGLRSTSGRAASPRRCGRASARGPLR